MKEHKPRYKHGPTSCGYRDGTFGEIIFGLCAYGASDLARLSGYNHSTMIRFGARAADDRRRARVRENAREQCVRLFAVINFRLGWVPGDPLLVKPSDWGRMGIDAEVRAYTGSMDHVLPLRNSVLRGDRRFLEATRDASLERVRARAAAREQAKAKVRKMLREGASGAAVEGLPRGVAGRRKMLADAYGVPAGNQQRRRWMEASYPHLYDGTAWMIVRGELRQVKVELAGDCMQSAVVVSDLAKVWEAVEREQARGTDTNDQA